MELPLSPTTQAKLAQSFSPREGETRLGQKVRLLPGAASYMDALTQAKGAGARFAIIGIKEDLGPRANLGQGGANQAFDAMLPALLNQQSNRFLSGEECLLLGEITPVANTANDCQQLRQEVESLDQQVIEALTPVFAAGLEPIVIGGGHNNAFGILSAARAALSKPLAAVNLDPHSDFRLREGRHSGNGFSYAAANGALGHYHVLGLHELKNSETNLEQLTAFGGSWHSLQQIWVRRELSLEQALSDIARQLRHTGLPVAIELDLDAITQMPSSASTVAGIPLLDAAHYVSHMARHTPSVYLHLAEGAPACHDAGLAAGYKAVGQCLAELIYAYLQAKQV
ncbi:TPA: formimidoylglutamase [Shewanella algae]|uniref:formimidoylglutamase n=1 Tax=Shewanella algae TaxID=38313 RepID=UPI001C56686F|nr:formimidoylglutamase [Shewanella algae]HDS1201670.1 formimidoylglutamase [Shewanella algae]